MASAASASAGGSLLSMRYWIPWVQAFFIGHMFKQHIGEISQTQGPSMLPSMNVRGDWVYVDKLYRRGKGVRAGDLVTIKHPLVPNERAIKRIVGMPGDYVLKDTPGSGSSQMIQVPEGHVWLAGDNLPWSRDSRDYGPIPMALIRGKITARLLPFSEMGWMKNTLHPVRGDLSGSTTN